MMNDSFEHDTRVFPPEPIAASGAPTVRVVPDTRAFPPEPVAASGAPTVRVVPDTRAFPPEPVMVSGAPVPRVVSVTRISSQESEAVTGADTVLAGPTVVPGTAEPVTRIGAYAAKTRVFDDRDAPTVLYKPASPEEGSDPCGKEDSPGIG